MVETFFKTLKSELVWRTAFQTRAKATVALARYIEGFYNPRRGHSALGYTSPIQFERDFTQQTALHKTEASPAFTCFTPQECRKYLAAAGYEDDLAVAT